MRRLLSILLVALFWAGPVSALLPASTEGPLPACCRRHGAHHCAMTPSDGTSGLTGRAFAAPAHCSQYHQSGPATTPTFIPPVQPSLAQLPQAPAPVSAIRSAVLHRARNQASRGPPASL